MEAIDMKKLETAITYIQRIADGHNPINNLPADEESVLNNPNVIRCMFFVKEILEEVKRNGGYIEKKTPKTEKLDFPKEMLKSFVYKEDKTITKFVEQLNEGIDENIYKKLTYKPISQWLKLNGVLQEENSLELKKVITMPTQKGFQVGIRAEKRSNSSGIEYMRLIYGKQAQEYIVQNLEKILSGEVAE